MGYIDDVGSWRPPRRSGWRLRTESRRLARCRRLEPASALGLGALAATLLLRPSAADAVDDLDPTKFTCLVPILEGQSLTDSEIWQKLLDAGSAEVNKETQGLAQLAESRAGARTAEWFSQEVKPSLPSANDVPGLSGMPEFHANAGGLDVVLRRVGREAARTCARDFEATSAVGRGIADMHAAVQDIAKKGFPVEGAPVQNVVHDVAKQASAVHMLPGVRRLMEVVEDPRNIAHFHWERSYCAAKNGSFCLSSLIKGREKGFTALQLCALERTTLLCPPGFFCEGGTKPPVTCRGGTYCPMGSSRAKYCDPGYFCPIAIMQKPCGPGLHCPEGYMMPSVCPDGYFCPSGIAVVCPVGHFCGAGAASPTGCPRLANCPAQVAYANFETLAHVALAATLLAFGFAIASVPAWVCSTASVRRVVPAGTAVLFLSVAWCMKFDVLALAANALGASPEQAEELSMRRLFGGQPHAKSALFLTLTYTYLLYGLLISTRIPNRHARQCADAAVFCGVFMAFAATLHDQASLLFMSLLLLAFRVVWALLTKQGSLRCRVMLLGAGLLAVAVGLYMLGAVELVAFMGFSLFAASAREWAQSLVANLQALVRRRRLRSAESVLSESPFPPLIASLPAEALDGRGSVQDLVAAVCITAGARASFAEHHSAGSLPCGSIASRAMDLEAWAAWDTAPGRPGRGVCFELASVAYSVNRNRKLLHDITLVVPGAASVAVMGASGSGKTTLLSVLSGRCGDGRFAGLLRLDGVAKLPWQMSELRSLVGYVPQDDVLHIALTASENMDFQAQLRMPRQEAAPSEFSSGAGTGKLRMEISERVAAVVQGLGLAQVRDRGVRDGLSGGQRKRVSIGMELVAQPRVLLLDEPTTGLDSATAHRIMDLVLHNAQEERCTTFATIHQPRWPTLCLFDMLVLLAPGGYLCYAGPVATLQAYFEEVLHVVFLEDENPADTIIDVCTFDSARRMALEGTWKDPPQCLRAMLFPTPDAASEDKESGPWQALEFGRMMAALWSDFSALRIRLAAEAGRMEAGEGAADAAAPAIRLPSKLRSRSPSPEPPSVELSARGADSANSSQGEGAGDDARPTTFCCPLEQEARARAEIAHWAEQVWVHLTRTLLLCSREMPTMAFHVVLLLLAMMFLGWSFPSGSFVHCFLQTALLLLLLCLIQSVASQRLFGGEEKHIAMREASVTSLSQVVFSFVGKDAASLVEILLSSLVFVFAYGPYANTYASLFDMYEVGFALTYALWGANHVLSVAFPSSTAMLLSVIFAFVSFLFTGLKPRAVEVMASLGGYGRVLMLLSPVRWALTNWLFHHVVSGGTFFLSGPVMRWVGPNFKDRGFAIDDLPTPPDRTIGERWADGSGWSTHTGQLFLLGFLFRFLAVTCLMASSSAKASGGQLSLGAASMTQSNIMRDCLVICLAFFSAMCVMLLGRTW